jgi:hypothetical protein
VNRYENFISEYLRENKEVALSKIGILKATSPHPDHDDVISNIEFKCDKKIATSPELLDFIAEKTGKNKSLVISDIESHFTQAREYINIGKTYEIPDVGFIKANNSGEYELTPFSQTNKPQKKRNQPIKPVGRSSARSAVQFFTFLIVLAILAGIGWQAYQFFIKSKTQNTPGNISTNAIADTVMNRDTTSGTAQALPSFRSDDTVLVRYIFETTTLLLRAKTRTEKLKSFGNLAGFDSFTNEHGKFYSLFIYKRTKIADTLAVKDSLAKFLQKNIQVQIAPKQ